MQNASVSESTEKKEDASGKCLRKRILVSSGHARKHRGQLERRKEVGSVSLTDKPDTLQVTPSVSEQCGGLLFQTSLNSCVGAPHSTPSFAQCPHEWEINKEIQEVLIWHFVDFFPEPFVSYRYGAPWFWLSWCIFPKNGTVSDMITINKEMRKLTLV